VTTHIRLLMLSSALCFPLWCSAFPAERTRQPARLAPEDRSGAESRSLARCRPSGRATGFLQVEPRLKVSALLAPWSHRVFLDSPRVQDAAGTALVRVRPPASGHRFWDRRNGLLFAAVGASRTLDYFSTLNMRRRGDQEILLNNDVVDNHPAFAAVEAAATAVSVGASYLFHRYHHHRLERWTSIVHASLATSGAVRNYCLKTVESSPTP
jgi:hypothetical protein